MYSQENIFSPLNGDVSLQNRFAFDFEKDGAGNAFESTPLSPHSQFSVEADAQYKSIRRYSVARKPLPVYKQVNKNHNESLSAMQADESSMENDTKTVPVKRGWRFYGTFATLALVNLICAIDATILSVALQVR